MSTTFGQFKSAIRGRIWPPGSAEPDNLVASHDKDFIDSLVDLQTWVPCLQQDNTDLYPQCSTTYNCGLTVLPAPRGIIKKLSVIDKIDPDTHLESAAAADDYCSEVAYTEVDYCHVRRFLDRSRSAGGCCGIGAFFSLSFVGYRPRYPTPTDEGVAAGLPPLPMGFHYPQASTDRTWGRAGNGIWAKERGNIFVAPWIQSTETIIVVWDGIKRTWGVGDPIDDDPMLSKAVEEYVRWQHARKWDKDEMASADAQASYGVARQELIHQCREETRTRQCEPSHARASTIGLSSLYFNDEQAATVQCPQDQTGSAVTVVIQSGTVGSNKSVSDANAKAKAQATFQAQAQLVCTDIPTVYYSSQDWTYNATCATDGTQETGAPIPLGSGVSVTIKVGTAFPTATSQDNADTMAQALAKANAISGLSCTYGNAPQTATKACADGVTGLVSVTVPMGTKTALSQSQADALAMTKAQNDADAEYSTNAVDCGDGSSTTLFWNTEQRISVNVPCSTGVILNNWVSVTVIFPAHRVTGTSQFQANMAAQKTARTHAWYIANLKASRALCGGYTVTYPDSV